MTWLGMTVLVDFFIVPTVFRTVPDFFVAGELGIQLFKRFNIVELILAIFLGGLGLFYIKQVPTQRWFIITPILLFSIVALYCWYLTPKIAELTAAWAYADKMGTLGAKGAEDIQQLHQTYHRTYVGIDSVKLLLLFIQGLGLGLQMSRRPK